MDHSNKLIVKYRQQYYDITQFAHKHPGGTNIWKGLNNGDMTGRFLKAPPHSDAAMYLMNEYKISGKHYDSHSQTNRRHTLQENGIELLDQHMEGEKTQLLTDKEEKEDKNNNHLDDSMEHLVDWSKAMLPQIGTITKHYDEWVHKPVDRELRLFGPWYLEMCTKTPWWLVPTFWLPVIIRCAWQELESNWHNFGDLTVFCSYLLLGMLFWTLLEYTLHRWVFHIKLSSTSSSWLCTFHFLIHGLHHKVPFDPMRLVFPPLPGVVLATIIYAPISFILPHPRSILSGALIGYLCYDMIHYYLHYGNPRAKHLYHMKRYHYQHHFAHQDLGYGISSPLWDVVFQTRIKLRKLKCQLRWS